MPFNVTCSKCQKTLKVPDEAAGKRVRCPACQEIIAVSAAAETSTTAAPPPAPLPATTPSSAGNKKKAAWDADDNEEEEEEEERPAKTKSKKSESDNNNAFDFESQDEEEEDRRRRKRKRRRRDDDDDYDDYDDYGRRPRWDRPHRASTVLMMGIFSIVLCCAPVIGISLGMGAINMANADLAQMASQRMDPSGRGTTQTGRSLGIVGCILSAIMLVVAILLTVAGGGRR